MKTINTKSPALLIALGLGALLFVSKANASSSVSRRPGSVFRGSNGVLYRVGANGRTLTPTGGNVGSAGNVQGFGQPATINLGGLLTGLANAIKSATSSPSTSTARAPALSSPASAPAPKPSSSSPSRSSSNPPSSSSRNSPKPVNSPPPPAEKFDPKDFDPTDVYDANDARARQSPDPVGLPDGGAFDQYGDGSPGVGDAGGFDQGGTGNIFDNVMPGNDGFAPGDYGAFDQTGSEGVDYSTPSFAEWEAAGSPGYDPANDPGQPMDGADPGFDPSSDYGGDNS